MLGLRISVFCFEHTFLWVRFSGLEVFIGIFFFFFIFIFIFKGDFLELHHRVRGLETWTWGVRLGFLRVFFSAVARFHRRGGRVFLLVP